MFGSKARENKELLTQMERQLDRIHTALLVRDPGTSLSSDAYEGLRKQVVASARARTQHVAQLAEIDVALRRGASITDLQNLVDGWLRQAGIERIEDPRVPDVWDSVPNSREVEVEIPAYVDTEVRRLVHQGRLRERNVEPEPNQNIAVAEGQPDLASVPAVGGELEVEPRSNEISFPDDAAEDSAESESILDGAPVEGTDAETDADAPKES
ncbi:hypothetical protein JOF28_001607 [Leucobacter exalbidus]|uniref:Uncharacterized protein n=1 Tax=Leucobacter exalbidus TaxID=662960 RepID=A0A940PUD3_9MICO|nr:hypothetical protein [Leucobacter exalbidus]MBP1326375.1 hypothetical protein [Leucobacter exalbidus]